MSVGLYLMTQKGLAVLEAALDSGVQIAHVTTAAAEGMNDDAHHQIAARAKAYGLPTFLRAHPPEYAGAQSVAAGWRWMLDVPNLVVLHDSLLPRYRGFSPLITALVNGETEVGVTAFLAEAEPDTGPIVGQRRMPVRYPARMRDVLDQIAALYGSLAAEVLTTMAVGAPLPQRQQDHGRASWSVWRDEDDYRIDWGWDARKVVRLVDAASEPFPGAWTTANGQKGRVARAVMEPDVRIEDRVPGKVAFIRDGAPVVVCGTGMVRLPGVDVPLRTRFV
jgi:methionyl-tRNA formyltransferase